MFLNLNPNSDSIASLIKIEKGLYIGLPSGRVSVPIFRPDSDRMPGRVSVPRLETDPPVSILKTDSIRQEPEF